jgi:hypothetical protein
VERRHDPAVEAFEEPTPPSAAAASSAQRPVAVRSLKKGHDMRFDIPATVRARSPRAQGRVSAFRFQAGRLVKLERRDVVAPPTVRIAVVGVDTVCRPLRAAVTRSRAAALPACAHPKGVFYESPRICSVREASATSPAAALMRRCVRSAPAHRYPRVAATPCGPRRGLF